MKKLKNPDAISGITSKVMLVSTILLTPTTMMASKIQGGIQTPLSVVQQSNSINGTIVDELGEPMIGVTIKKKGSGVGAITDLDGKFSVNVPVGTVLEISYTGYKTLTISAKQNMGIKMEPDAIGLEELVVVGYGTQKKRDLTGSVVSVKNEDVVATPTSNVMEALQGKIAGLDITKSSGQVGGGVNILLRGSRSIYGDNSPLFIIDGLPGSYDDISPNDIESIDVLKDASSTAIYGSAGANGVIIITTKRGAKSSKTRVNFDAYYGWSGSPEYKSGMTGDEWVNYYTEAYKYKNGVAPASVSDLFGGNQDYVDAYNAGKWIDWVDQAMDNKTLEIMKTRRSVRGFIPGKMPESSLIDKVIEAGTYAPTGRGKQSPVIVAVTNKETRDLLSKLNAEVLGVSSDPFYGAPVVLVVLADKSVPTYIYDGSLVMGNLMNAAHAVGLASCWIHRAKEVFASAQGKALLKEWGIEGDYEGIGHCVLGFPVSAEQPVAKPRKSDYVVYVK